MDEYLLGIAEELNCTVTHKKTKGCVSFIIEFNDNYYINIDTRKLESEIEQRVCLAHELGHCISGTTYTINHSPLYRGAAEYRANFRAAQLIVPIDCLLECLSNGIYEKHILAEHFSVSEDFIDTALTIYKNKGLLDEAIHQSLYNF